MIHKWWHTFVRRRMKRPVPEDQAILWSRRLSFAYAFFAWNAFGFVVYNAFKGKADWADYYGLKSEDEQKISPGEAWAKTLGIKNAKVYRISGFTKSDEYDIVDGVKVRIDKKDTQVGIEGNEEFS